MKPHRLRRHLITGVGILLIAGCGGSDPAPPPAVAAPGFTVGGSLQGSNGSVVLLVNGGAALTLTADGAFTFSSALATGTSFAVTVQSHPAAQHCTVANGSGTIGSSNVTNVRVSCAANVTTLSASVNAMALSVTGLVEYGVSATPSSGAARHVTITNTGANAAYNVAVTPPVWPAGTTSATTCGATLLPGDTCAVTVTPGATASSDGSNPCTTGTAPVPGTIQVAADNANAVTIDAVVLGYGCIYQGGYAYAFDDTTPGTASVGGKVVATSDQAAPYPNGVIWSSDGSGSVAYDAVYAISEASTAAAPGPASGQSSGQVACDGALDGSCDTNNIDLYYQNVAAGAPVNRTYYAAGLCRQSISGYSDWSLPALCELGYGGVCGMSGAPALQNVQSSLVDYNSLGLLAGYYWSSTEVSAAPANFAWGAYLGVSSGTELTSGKGVRLGVRCSRALVP